MLTDAGVRTVIDVRRFAGSRRNPQFNPPSLASVLEDASVAYRNVVALGGRLKDEPDEDLFGCIRVAAFRSYAARMRTPAWQAALRSAVAEGDPCFLCAETLWWRCHRRLIAELLHARGEHVVHLLATTKQQEHRPWSIADTRDGKLYLCGELVA